MNRTQVLTQLKDYFVQNVFDDADEDFNEYTSLQEWGLLNSLEIARLVAFIQITFALDVPPERMNTNFFQSLHMITDLILDLSCTPLD